VYNVFLFLCVCDKVVYVVYKYGLRRVMNDWNEK